MNLKDSFLYCTSIVNQMCPPSNAWFAPLSAWTIYVPLDKLKNPLSWWKPLKPASEQSLTITDIKIQKIISKPDMTDAYENSAVLETDEYSAYYKKIVSYMSGFCWINSKISNKFHLNDGDQAMVRAISEAQKVVKPFKRNLYLFHGFERLTHYGDHNWKVGQIIEFPWALSKTPVWRIAYKFAESYEFGSWFLQKFMFVRYPPGSKHICLNTRPPETDEYEHLAIGERLTLKDVVYEFQPFPPQIRKYYVFDA